MKKWCDEKEGVSAAEPYRDSSRGSWW